MTLIKDDLLRQLKDCAVLYKFDNGRENMTFLVSYQGTELVLRIYLTKSIGDIVHEINMLKHVNNHINISKAVEIDGKTIFNISGLPAVFFERINLSQVNSHNCMPQFFYRLGYDLGRLHAGTRSCNYRLFWCHDAVVAMLRSNSTLSRFIVKKYGIDLEREFRLFNHFSAGDKCIIHGDVSFSNLFYDFSNDSIYFIDFDDSTTSCVGLDVGIAIRNLFLKASANQSFFEHFKSGYLSANYFDFSSTFFWVKLACLRYVYHMEEKSAQIRGYKNDLRKNLALLDKCLQYGTRAFSI